MVSTHSRRSIKVNMSSGSSEKDGERKRERVRKKERLRERERERKREKSSKGSEKKVLTEATVSCHLSDEA